MKLWCYKKSIIALYTLLTVLAFVLTVCLFIFDDVSNNILWAILIVFATVIASIQCVYMYCYVLITEDEIILKGLFGTIVSLKIADCVVYRTELATMGTYGGINYRLCIYDKNNIVPFSCGYQNSKKYNRIQLIDTTENYRWIESVLEWK
ncbi:MAG: hypothetical protein NC350_01120 [Corallococcus sp.]|nr:hypothetical protein [Corallococcus sp.]